MSVIASTACKQYVELKIVISVKLENFIKQEISKSGLFVSQEKICLRKGNCRIKGREGVLSGGKS